MRATTPVRGHTLVELVSVLILLAVGASSVAPTARRLLHRASVLSAREEIVRAVALARAAAVSSGGAAVTIVATPPRVRVSISGATSIDSPLGDGPISVGLTGGRDSLGLRFDRFGIGRFANGSVTLRRGDAEAGLVISSYGRVRRR